MFDWFKNKDKEKYPTLADLPDANKAYDEANNVVKFPEPKAVPKMPEVVPPADKPATIYYRFGVTDNNRLAFQMGYSEITMNRQGCQDLIDQLTFFMNQLEAREEDENTNN
jgi:hypothetical protein